MRVPQFPVEKSDIHAIVGREDKTEDIVLNNVYGLNGRG